LLVLMLLIMGTKLTVLAVCRDDVVAQYVGAPVCPVPAPHGNSFTNRPFIRTNPSVLDKIKQAVQVTVGHAAPAKVYKEAVRNETSVDPRVCLAT